MKCSTPGHDTEIHLPIAEADAQPRIKQRVEPVYPGKSQEISMSADVALVLVVGDTGAVLSARACDARALLAPEALAAARQWVFEPIRRSGLARSAVVAVRVRFLVQ